MSSLGRVPERLLNDKSMVMRSIRFAMAIGTGPVRLFFDSILWSSNEKNNWSLSKSLLVSLTHATSPKGTTNDSFYNC